MRNEPPLAKRFPLKPKAIFFNTRAPLKDAIEAIANKTIPSSIPLEGISRVSEMSDKEAIALVQWCHMNPRPCWATGAGIIKAAEAMVEAAKGVGNI